METTDAPATAPTPDQPGATAAPGRGGPGGLILATIGIAALAPVLIAQSRPAARPVDLVEATDSPPAPLRPLDPPTLLVVEPASELDTEADTVASVEPGRGAAKTEAAAARRDGRRAQRKANRQAVRRDGGVATAVDADSDAVPEPVDATVEADGALATHEAVPAPAASANLSPEAAAVRTARRAQRKVARRNGTEAPGGAVTLIVPELPAGETSQSAMIDHVAKLTVSLGQAHRLIHTLSVEKFKAQKELALLKNEPVPETITLPQPGNRRAKAAVPERARRGRNAAGQSLGAAREGEEGDEANGPLDEVAFMEAKQVARQRQLLALGVVVAIAVFALMYNYMDWHWFPNIGDRQALASLAYVGGFVQIFFMGWMFFRFARIGGKGARWLFPSEEDQIKQVRRKKQNEAQKAHLQQIKERRKETGSAPTAPKRDAATA